MYPVELYVKVRRAVAGGMSRREAAAYFGLHRNTISKMIEFPEPPEHGRTGLKCSRKLKALTGVIDQILNDDRKQQHSAYRIFERLRDEHSFSGGRTIVRNYVARAKLRTKEVFIPLSHRPGHAQVDFGEADTFIAGQKVRFHYFCMDLPQSDACFVKAYPAETAEAFCDGHVSAFAFFGGIPLSILYDNPKRAVAKILGNGARVRSRMFSTLQSHYLFEDKFGRPSKGNDKGHVEGLVGYSRRQFMVPIPVVGSLDELNVVLLDKCTRRQVAVLRSHTLSIEMRLQDDSQMFKPLPAVAFDPCHIVASRVASTSLVRYRTNDYSVPTRHGYQEVAIKAYVSKVDIIWQGQVIASHKRCYKQEDFIYNPLHYLPLLERKPHALDQAAPLEDWLLAEPVHRLRRLLEARMGKHGKREFIQVLRLCEHFDQPLVEAAVADALRIGAISFDAVKMLALAKLECRPAKLDLSLYPYLPKATVGITDPRSYMNLLAGAAHNVSHTLANDAGAVA